MVWGTGAALDSMISIMEPSRARTKTVVVLGGRQLMVKSRCSTYHWARRSGSGDAIAVCSMPVTIARIVAAEERGLGPTPTDHKNRFVCPTDINRARLRGEG